MLPFNILTFFHGVQIYHVEHNQRSPSLTPRLFSIVPYLSKNSLGGNTCFSSLSCYLFYFFKRFSNINALIGFVFVPRNAPAPNVFPMLMSINVDEALQRELKNDQIWQELENEEIQRYMPTVRDEIGTIMGVGGRSQERNGTENPVRISFREWVPMSFNQRQSYQGNNISIFDVQHFPLASQVGTKQPFTLSCKDKNVLMLVGILSSEYICIIVPFLPIEPCWAIIICVCPRMFMCAFYSNEVNI